MLRLSCPCGMVLKVNEALAGKRINCPKCATVHIVPDSAPPVMAVLVPSAAPSLQPDVQSPPITPPATRPLPGLEPDDAYDRERPRRKPKRKKSGSGLILWALLGCGGFTALLMCVGGGIGAYFFWFAKKTEVAVKFWVPKKVGDVRDIDYSLDMFDKFDDQVGAGAKTSNSRTSAYVFKGKIKTLGVAADGRETRAEVTVDVLRGSFNGQEKMLLAPGTVMVVEDKGTFIDVRYQNGAVHGDAIGATLLRKAVNMTTANNEPDEIGKILATSEPKTAGATWTANKEALLTLINKNRADKVPVEAVSGTAKVVGIVKEGAVSYVDLEVTVTVTLKDFTETVIRGKPANVKVNSEDKWVYTYRFPADYSTGPVKSSVKSHRTARHEGIYNGQNAVFLTEVRDGWSETAKYSSESGGGKAK
jgi:hypothetical protein